MMTSVGGNQDHQIEMTGVQPCYGDSGGPIFQADAKHLILQGVISNVAQDDNGAKCVSNGHAISVFFNLPWIRKAAKDLRTSFDI